MALSVSPKKWATDISEGMITINRVMLRKYTPADLRIMLNALMQALKELRSTPVPEGDFQALKLKNMKMTRVNQANLVINAYIKKARLKV